MNAAKWATASKPPICKSVSSAPASPTSPRTKAAPSGMAAR